MTNTDVTPLFYPTVDYANWLANSTLSYDLYDINGTFTYVYDDSTFYTADLNDTRPTNSSLPLEISFSLPVWRKIVWSVLFAAIVMVATGGNLIVVWIVLSNKRMRTVTNYFIVNLSIADAMVSALNVTFNYVYMVNFHWPFGVTYCKISSFVATLSVSASVFTLMAISIDRYLAIIKPLRPRMGKRTTLTIAAFAWLMGSLLSLPNLLYFTTYWQTMRDSGYRIVCYMEWPDGATSTSMLENVYNIAFMFLTYILPIGAMVYAYTRVGIELWGSQSIGECSQRQLDNIQSKRRVVKMMIWVVAIFAICWLPYHVYFIVGFYYPELNNWAPIQEVYLGIYWLAMSNSMYNPIIYCWMNQRFRRGFKQFFQFCPFVRLLPEQLQRREVLTSRHSCSGSPDHNRIVRNGAGSVRIPMHLSTAHNSAINHQSFNVARTNVNNKLQHINHQHHHHHHQQHHQNHHQQQQQHHHDSQQQQNKQHNIASSLVQFRNAGTNGGDAAAVMSEQHHHMRTNNNTTVGQQQESQVPWPLELELLEPLQSPQPKQQRKKPLTNGPATTMATPPTAASSQLLAAS